MNPLPPLLTSDQLKALTARHIARYESLLRAHAKGVAGIRPAEALDLLAIWKRIATLDGSIDSTRYTSAEIGEIGDAWFDEYDQFGFGEEAL